MTTDNQKKLEIFYDSVVDTLSRKHVEFHWPGTLCSGDSCEGTGLSRTNSSTQRCNWNDIQGLVAEFFRGAPDVPQTWKWRTWKIGLAPDAFHDLLIGIFIGSEQPRRRPIRTEWFPPETPKFYLKGARS